MALHSCWRDGKNTITEVSRDHYHKYGVPGGGDVPGVQRHPKAQLGKAQVNKPDASQGGEKWPGLSQALFYPLPSLTSFFSSLIAGCWLEICHCQFFQSKTRVFDYMQMSAQNICFSLTHLIVYSKKNTPISPSTAPGRKCPSLPFC